MKTNQLSISICMIAIFLLSPGILYPQGFQTKEVSDNVTIVSNPAFTIMTTFAGVEGFLGE